MSASDRLASGGDYEGESGGHYYHIFTSSGTLSVNRSGSVEVLLIAGGGAGGLRATQSNIAAGGGGAGGLLVTTASLSVGDKSIVLGDGGTPTENTPTSGSDSTALGLTAFGGGGGDASAGSDDALTGGSGGGGAAASFNRSSGAPAIGDFTPVTTFAGVGEQGCHGGAGNSSNPRGGGGGGAGSPGHDGNATNGTWKFDATRGSNEDFGEEAAGGWGARLDSWGAGASSVAGTAIGDEFDYTPDAGGTAQAYFFAGGGSGGNDGGSGVTLGPPGGGGNGASTTTAGTDGVDGLGGGGGGGANTNAAGAGGSGLCIVRYPV